MYLDLEDFLLSLGDDINIWGYSNIITVRKIKALAFIMIDEFITILVDDKQYIIKNIKDLRIRMGTWIVPIWKIKKKEGN